MAQAATSTGTEPRIVHLNRNGSTFEVDLDNKRLRVNRRPVHLSEREGRLLMFLVEFQGKVQSKKRIVQEMHNCGFGDFNEDRLRSLVNVLRGTLNASRAGAAALVETRPNGYLVDV